METMNKLTTIKCAIGACILSVGALHAFAQQIPASSADSGRRAIVSISQGNIYNSINSAQSTANAAYNYADAAYYNSEEAKRRADAAASKGGGFATGFLRMHMDMNSPNSYLVGACVYLAGGPTSGMMEEPYQANYRLVPFTCPAGSSFLFWSGGAYDTEGDGSDSGGGGGGGGGG
jgi:hypothetical protein